MISALAAATGGVLTDVTFERCRIVGPALIATMDTDVVHTTLGAPDARSFFWYIPPERVQAGMLGVTRLRRCVICECNLENIGMGVTDAMLPKIREAFALPPGAIVGESGAN